MARLIDDLLAAKRKMEEKPFGSPPHLLGWKCNSRTYEKVRRYFLDGGELKADEPLRGMAGAPITIDESVPDDWFRRGEPERTF